MIMVAGKWFDWWGGLTWCYRSVVDTAPFVALLIVPIVDRIVASRPLRVVCGVLLAWSIAVQFVGAYSYSLMGWSDLSREYDRSEQATLWRWDRPRIGYHLANFSSERARKSEKASDGHLCHSYEPPTKSVIHRVVMNADTEALEATLHRYAKPRLPVPAEQTQRQALAADGKRIRGANRNGTVRYETATLVEHSSGVPLASLNFHDQNGELAAVGALLEVTPIADALITLDALHTTREVAASIVAQHRADYLLTVKRNCPETYQALATMPWEQAAGRFCEQPQKGLKGHGRIDCRHIEVLTLLPNTINYPHVAQVFRVRRERTDLSSGTTSVTYAYGITSVAAEDASPKQLLAWNRGHWAVESKNHQRRDKTLDEDAGLARTGLAPANRATCNNLVLALILNRRQWDNAAVALRHFTLHRKLALQAVLSPA